MDSEITLYGFRALGCIQVLVVFGAAACAAFVAAKARGLGLRTMGPTLLAGSLVVSALNGVFFSVLDWAGVESDIYLPMAIAASFVEVLIAVAFVAGFALLGRTKATTVAP